MDKGLLLLLVRPRSKLIIEPANLYHSLPLSSTFGHRIAPRIIIGLPKGMKFLIWKPSHPHSRVHLSPVQTTMETENGDKINIVQRQAAGGHSCFCNWTLVGPYRPVVVVLPILMILG